MKAAVLGASGYAGTELLRLCAMHPELEVVVATAHEHAGRGVAAHTPSLAAAYPGLAYDPTTADRGELDGLDVVFCALPHGESQRLLPGLESRVGAVVDLGADFRLKDVGCYERWYGSPHGAPALVSRFAYGLPEVFRDEIVGSRLVAVPGCYPTAAILALAPLVRAGLLQSEGIVIDAASGVSGAGRGAEPDLQFTSVDEDFRAYGLTRHRHTPEMEQVLGAQLLFTPHLAPMVRGILATCYARPSARASSGDPTTDELLETLRASYADEPFVTVTDDPPSTKTVWGSNCAQVTVRTDPRTGWIVALCAIDNLVKGAAGQAVQCANLMLGFPEVCGLPLAGVYP